MKRAVLMAVATMSLLGVNAKADNFTFSFSQPGVGTVTGEIFGLQDDGAYHPATEVLITSAPASFEFYPVLPFDPIATDWDQQNYNTFQETGGVITDGDFIATSTGVVGLAIAVLSIYSGSFYTDAPDALFDDGIYGTATFAPVPEPFAWFLLLTVMLAVAIVKKKPAFLADPVTRMRG
jgi:hypothetical protein